MGQTRLQGLASNGRCVVALPTDGSSRGPMSSQCSCLCLAPHQSQYRSLSLRQTVQLFAPSQPDTRKPRRRLDLDNGYCFQILTGQHFKLQIYQEQQRQQLLLTPPRRRFARIGLSFSHRIRSWLVRIPFHRPPRDALPRELARPDSRIPRSLPF